MKKTWIYGLLFSTLQIPADLAATTPPASLHLSGHSLAAVLQQQTVSLRLKDASVKRLFEEIKRQTGVDFICSSELMKTLPTISVEASNEPLATVLSRVMPQLGCRYTIDDGILSVMPADRREREVSGVVRDETGEVLPGVPVRLQGSNRQTVTDADGRYTLLIPTDADATLELSYIGMRPATCLCRQGKANLRQDIRMVGDNSLDEVVVTGYQTISRERATGSYDIISGDELRQRHAPNLAKALDGLVPGMQSSDDGRGGKTFTIRGTSTLMADNTPLVVVDGFPVTDNPSSGQQQNPNLSALERLNPDNIESITILKDAAAASIWGARSANGVIVITTKKARTSQPLTIQASTQLSISQKQDVAHLTNLATSEQAIAYERWAFEHDMVGQPYSGSLSSLYYGLSPARLLMYKGYVWGALSLDEMNAQLSQLAAQSNRQQIHDHMLQRPIVSQTDVSISAGQGPWTTYAAAQFQHDKDNMIGSRDNTVKIDWNNSLKVGDRLNFTLGLNLVTANRHSSQIGLTDIASLAPYEMLLNGDGSYASQFHGSYNSDVLAQYNWAGFPYHDMHYNMLEDARQRQSRTTNTQMRTQLGMELKIIDGLRFNSKFQYEHANFRRRNTSSEESFYTRFQVNYYTPGDWEGNALGEASAVPMGDILVRSKGCNHSALFRNDFSFDRTFAERHAVSAVAGSEISNYYFTSHTLPYLYGVTATSSGQQGPSGYVSTMDASMSTVSGVPANGKTNVYDSWNHNRFVSFYANASYMFDERYGISGSARSDASNLITSEAKYRWSPLWSVGAMWNLHNEQWMRDKTPFDRLTLRLTYGQNGNAATSSSARTTINTSSSSVDDYTGLYPGTIADYGNPSLRWEKTATSNLGIDFSLLDNHLYGSVDLYNKRSTDVLGSVSIAAVHGTEYAVFNNAELTNRGIELQLGGRVDIGQLQLGANLAYSYNRNRVSKLYTEINSVSDMLNTSYVAGYSMGPIFTFTYDGLLNGVPAVVDKQGNRYAINDYTIYYMDAEDLLSYQGTTIAPHTASLSLSASWRGFTATAYLNSRFGGRMVMPTFNYYTIDLWGGKTNTTALVGDLLDSNGNPRTDVTTAFPLPTTDDAGNPLSYNEYGTWSMLARAVNSRIERSDYIYLSEIDLAYTLPQSWLGKGWVKGVDIFGKMENLGLLYAANSKNYHPDYLPGQWRPMMTITLGANVKF